MKILVINTGSSSIKYQLFDMATETVLATGMAERINEEEAELTHKTYPDKSTETIKNLQGIRIDHRQGLEKIAELLTDPEDGIIRDKSEISAVVHRVVHGGEAFQTPIIIDEAVITEIKRNTPLAPLHNPPNIIGIEVSRAIFPDATQVSVFDTAFHQTLPPRAYTYALPYDLYEQHRVRRYGFHGSSHAYVAKMAARFLGLPLEDLNLITLHLGNGASMAAVKNGQCIDTSMGLTPLEGLVMGTRTGDVDPAIPFFLANHLGMSLDEIDALLNKAGGLKGICGNNDMRTVLERVEKGDERAELALDVYTYRIKKYIGAYTAVLGKLDALVFTGGIGENAPLVRQEACADLLCLGIEMDKDKNRSVRGTTGDIGRPESKVRILIIPTNEELEIARETMELLSRGGNQPG